MFYQLVWKTEPGLRGLACREFKAVPTAQPDHERGVAAELATEAERDTLLGELERQFAAQQRERLRDGEDVHPGLDGDEVNPNFLPRLDVLPEAQQRLWEELRDTPSGFVLYGGTALALRLGHRQSEDFDFFSSEPLSPGSLMSSIPYLKGAEAIQSATNTLTCIVNRGGPVQVSFLGGLDLNHVAEPQRAGGVWVASLLDLMATKLAVLMERAAYKDYCDIDALLKAGLNLAEGLGAAQAVYGSRFNAFISLKALMFYGEGDLDRLDAGARARLTKAAEKVNPRELPVIVPRKGLLPA